MKRYVCKWMRFACKWMRRYGCKWMGFACKWMRRYREYYTSTRWRRFILRVVSKTYLTSESELDTFGNHELYDKSSSTGTSVVFYFLHTHPNGCLLHGCVRNGCKWMGFACKWMRRYGCKWMRRYACKRMICLYLKETHF